MKTIPSKEFYGLFVKVGGVGLTRTQVRIPLMYGFHFDVIKAQRWDLGVWSRTYSYICLN